MKSFLFLECGNTVTTLENKTTFVHFTGLQQQICTYISTAITPSSGGWYYYAHFLSEKRRPLRFKWLA